MKKNVVVITGGSGGIGRATALRFAEDGASVVIVGRKKEKLAAALALLPKGVVAFAADLTDPKEINRLIQFTLEQFGQIDTFVHAAEDFHAKALVEFGPEDVEHVLATIGMIYGVNLAALRQMNTQGSGGTIVNISSRAGILDDILAKSGGYSASKMAMSAITRSGNQEETRGKVRLLTLAIGGVDTAMGRQAAEKRGLAYDPDALLSPSEVAVKIVSLVSNPEKYPHDVWRFDKHEGLQWIGSSFHEPTK